MSQKVFSCVATVLNGVARRNSSFYPTNLAILSYCFQDCPTSSLLSMFFIQFLEFLNSCFDCLLFHTQLCPIIEMFKLFLVRLFFRLLLMAETFIEVIIQRNVRQLFFYNEIFEYPLVCKSMFECLMCSRRKVFFDMFL